MPTDSNRAAVPSSQNRLDPEGGPGKARCHGVERLTRRSVLAFISNSHVGPDLEIELFMLGPARAG